MFRLAITGSVSCIETSLQFSRGCRSLSVSVVDCLLTGFSLSLTPLHYLVFEPAKELSYIELGGLGGKFTDLRCGLQNERTYIIGCFD